MQKGKYFSLWRKSPDSVIKDTIGNALAEMPEEAESVELSANDAGNMISVNPISYC